MSVPVLTHHVWLQPNPVAADDATNSEHGAVENDVKPEPEVSKVHSILLMLPVSPDHNFDLDEWCMCQA